MTPIRHRRSFSFPYPVRSSLLVVFDGVPGSGRSTQLQRLREGQERAVIFAGDPLIVELPEDLECPEALRLRAVAHEALAAGRPVFAERWHPQDRTPDLLQLSLHSWTDPTLDRPAPPVLPPHVIVAPVEWESLVTLALMDELFGRRMVGTCPCQLAS